MQEEERRDEARRRQLRREMRVAAFTFGAMFLLAFLLAFLWARSVSGAPTAARLQPAGGGQASGGGPFFSALN